MNIKRMLVTGASGMVGSYVPKVFQDVDLIMTDIVGDCTKLDVRDRDSVEQTVRDVHPDIVLHLAAATNVDKCEQEPDLAYHTNTIGTQNVAFACQEYNALMVYISTAGVFWGDKQEPYTEFDQPRPANIYGHSKLQGEIIVSSVLQKYHIVRAGWMIGGGKDKDKKFVGKIVRLINDGQTHLKVVDDKFGSPTYGKDLLRGIHNLVKADNYGLFHMVNEGNVSRFQVSQAIAQIMKRPDIEIEPVSSAYFPLPAPRARTEAMRNYKLKLMGCPPQRSWFTVLEEYLTEELLSEMKLTE